MYSRHDAAGTIHRRTERSDVELMEEARDGDREAFGTLFERHADALRNFIYRIIGNHHRAEELTQEAFLQIYRARERYEPRAAFSTFLYRVGTNLSVNEIRRFETGKLEPLETSTSSDPSVAATRVLADETAVTPERQVALREAGEQVVDALRRLPANQREALLLSRVEGLPHREVARCLGTSPFAIKNLVFRARRLLRETVEEPAYSQ
jgi:RNA polymerase sigma-70 factor, ECF subfamily